MALLATSEYAFLHMFLYIMVSTTNILWHQYWRHFCEWKSPRQTGTLFCWLVKALVLFCSAPISIGLNASSARDTFSLTLPKYAKMYIPHALLFHTSEVDVLAAPVIQVIRKSWQVGQDKWTLFAWSKFVTGLARCACLCPLAVSCHISATSLAWLQWCPVYFGTTWLTDKAKERVEISWRSQVTAVDVN